MKHRIFSIAVLFTVFLFNSCIKDKGNYDYNYGNEVTITYAVSSYTIYLGDSLKVNPIRVYSNPQDTSDFDHEWYLNGVLYSTDKVLKIEGKVLATDRYKYYMVDRKSGVRNTPVSALSVITRSPYQIGWGILYEKDGKSELAHVSSANGVYTDYVDLYKKSNNGEELGSDPIMLKDYMVTGGRGLSILQHGGQGSVELDAYSLVKKNVTSKIFAGGSPSDFKPVDMAFATASDFLVNQNGDLYGRSFSNGYIAFSIPWIKTPIQIAGGMKIGDIWDSWLRSTYIGLMYDKLNNRLLYMSVEPNFNAAVSTLMVNALPTPEVPYPAAYTPLDNMGNWSYVWGGTFNDAGYNLGGAMLIRNPVDQQLYYETFTMTYSYYTRVTPGKRILFPGNALVTAGSKFAPVKTRGYLFFSGGANNGNLYYYDTVSETAPKLYASFGSKITAIVSSQEDPNLLAVGLEDGTFILYDVSNATIISGQSRELHRLTGLGRVADIALKGSVLKQQ